jgi:hypothetical protein
LQVWVGGEPLESFTPEAIEGKVLGEHESDFDAIALLDFLLGNGDRGQPTREHPGDEGVQINLGNYLIAHGGSPHESIVAIDYGDAFNYGSSIDPSKREAYYRLYTLPARVIERLQALKNPQNRKSLVAIVTELLGDSVATVFEERLDFILSVLHGNTVSLDREKNNQSK